MILNKLSQAMYSRRIFNPTNKKDLAAYGYFIRNSKWENGCPFWLEWPYQSVPAMIKDKIVRNMFSADRKELI